MTVYEAKVFEQGSGFPDVGDTLLHNDGRTFLVTDCVDVIHTNDPRGNFIYATVEETVSDDEPFEARIEFE